MSPLNSANLMNLIHHSIQEAFIKNNKVTLNSQLSAHTQCRVLYQGPSDNVLFLSVRFIRATVKESLWASVSANFIKSNVIVCKTIYGHCNAIWTPIPPLKWISKWTKQNKFVLSQCQSVCVWLSWFLSMDTEKQNNFKNLWKWKRNWRVVETLKVAIKTVWRCL